MSEPIETYNHDSIKCPWCGHIYRDSWELGDDDGERECGSCGRKYQWSRIISVSFTAKAITE